MKQSVTLPDVFLYCPSSKSAALGVARALQGLVCASPAQWPRINAAFAPVALPVQWTHLDGRQAGLSLLRLLNERSAPRRFNLVGHSMGCRVLCSGLQALAEAAALLARFTGSEFNVALLQPDADSDPLASGQLGIPKLRMLIATSDLDHLAVPVDPRFDITTTVVPHAGHFDINRVEVYELLARFFGQ